MSGLACGHRFCAACWAEYLTTKVMDDGMGQTISCAAHGCDILVDDETVMRLVSEARVLQRYQHLITNSFVEVRPHPGASKAGGGAEGTHPPVTNLVGVVPSRFWTERPKSGAFSYFYSILGVS